MGKYYDTNIPSIIEHCIRGRNYTKALNVAEEYCHNYPEDRIGFIFKARALVNAGRVNEGLELAKKIEDVRFHDIKSKITAYYWYGSIYFELRETAKAIEIFSNVLFIGDQVSLNCVNAIIDNLMDIGRYQDALDFLETYENYIYNSKYTSIRKANILTGLGRGEEALALLETIVPEQKRDERKIHLAYGKAYASLKKTDEAIEHYSQALGAKDFTYYAAITGLARCHVEKYNYATALRYLDTLEANPDYADIAIREKLNVYYDLWLPNIIRQSRDKIKDPHIQDLNQALYDYYSGNFAKAIPEFEKILSDEDEYFSSTLRHYIACVARNGDIDKALYYAEMVGEPSLEKTIRKMKVLGSNIDYDIPFSSLEYSVKQMVSYSRNRTLAHVYYGHRKDLELFGYNTREEVDELIDQITEKLPTAKHITDDIFDKSFVEIQKDGKTVLFHVINIPGTTNIITLYPLIDYISDIEPAVRVYKARKSKIELFNEKYGLKSS